MGRKTRRQPAGATEKKASHPTLIEFIAPEADNSVSSTGLIKLKPITSLISSPNDVLATQFAFGENSLSDPFSQLSQQVSVPSEEDCPEVVLNLPADSVAEESAGDSKKQTPNEEKADAQSLITPAKTNRKFKKPLSGSYRKVTDFFSATPRPKAIPQDKENVANNKKKKSETTVPSNNSLPQPYKDKPCEPITKFDVRKLRNRSNRNTSKTPGMGEFYDRTGGGEGTSSCYKTPSSSPFPVIISGQFDVDKIMETLRENVNHSELIIDLDRQKRTILIDVKEGLNLACQEQVVSAIRNVLDHSGEYTVEERPKEDSRANTERMEDDVEVIEPMEDDVISISSSDNDVMPVKKQEKKVKPPARKSGRKTKTKAKAPKVKPIKAKVACPDYKIVKGTHFAVDAFRYGSIDGVTKYFLTHFHSDHYVGLTKKFAHPLIMSPITANLVRRIIKVDEKYIRQIDLNSPIMVDDVEVTALDANQ